MLCHYYLLFSPHSYMLYLSRNFHTNAVRNSLILVYVKYFSCHVDTSSLIHGTSGFHIAETGTKIWIRNITPGQNRLFCYNLEIRIYGCMPRCVKNISVPKIPGILTSVTHWLRMKKYANTVAAYKKHHIDIYM